MKHPKYFILIMTLLLSACSTTHTLDKRVTEDNYRAVTVENENTNPTQEPIRFWPDQKFDFLFSENGKSTPINVTGEHLNILALSGGGANGAFGAGIVNGLYDSGKLEEYTIVTGISAGSLIAPFVFVGGDEIPRLKNVMLALNDDMVLGKHNFLNAVFKDAFTDGDSLFKLIERIYTPQMIDKIATQHKAGRRLFIGTSHFDSNEPVIWNVGQIAQSELPNKQHLIHQILAASSSIPGVFPPQFIEVNYKGEHFEELHVDGGMTAQAFFEPGNLDYSKLNTVLGLSTKPQVHVIRNGVLKLPYEALEDKGVPLLNRSINSMVVQQMRGDMYRMLYFSEIDDLDLSFTYIDESFKGQKVTKDMFELEYMKMLYQFGYQHSIKESPWTTEIPN